MKRLPLKFFRGACRDRAAGKRRIIKVLFRVSLRCRAGAQDLVKMRHEGDRRDRSCQNIADRLSRQYGEYFVLKELRKDKDQRDQEDRVFENQALMKLPVVRNGKQATVGYCPETWATWK